MKGYYTGFYKYKNERIQNLFSRDQTFFDLQITGFDGKNFSGIVKDEPIAKTGSGTVTGELNGVNISFAKKMSFATSISTNGYQRKHENQHPKIYYEGIYSDNKFKGIWRIKFGFLFIGFLPIPTIPTSGIWEMRNCN